MCSGKLFFLSRAREVCHWTSEGTLDFYLYEEEPGHNLRHFLPFLHGIIFICFHDLHNRNCWSAGRVIDTTLSLEAQVAARHPRVCPIHQKDRNRRKHSDTWN